MRPPELLTDLPIATYRAGEIIPWELQLLAAETDEVEELTGRSFVATIVGADGGEVRSIAGEVAGGTDSHVRGLFPGTVSAGLTGQAALRLQVSEIFRDGTVELGRKVLVDQPFRVRRAPATLSVSPAVAASATPTTRYVVHLAPDGDRTLVSNAGAAGASAALQVHRARPEELVEPTDQGLTDWLAGLAGDASGNAPFVSAHGETALSAVERVRTLDVEEFRYPPNVPRIPLFRRSDRATILAMLARMRQLAALGIGGMAMLAAATYSVGHGHLCEDGGIPNGWSLIGQGTGSTYLSVTADDPAILATDSPLRGRGNVLNTRGGNRIGIRDLTIEYARTGVTPADFAVVLDDGADQNVRRVTVVRGYGTVEVGRTGNVSRPVVAEVTHASWRASLGGDHIRLRQLSSLLLIRPRCNTSELLAPGAAFYAFRPDTRATGLGGENRGIDTVVMIAPQGQNSLRVGNSGAGILLDFTYGNIYTVVAFAGVADHCFEGSLVVRSAPWSVDGVLQKPAIRNIGFQNFRFTADAGPCIEVNHQGNGRLSDLRFGQCHIQSAIGAFVRIGALGPGYFEAPTFTGCDCRATGALGEQIDVAFDLSGPLRFYNGSIGRLYETDSRMVQLGVLRTAAAWVRFTENEVDNLQAPAFLHFGGTRHPLTRITGNVGVPQDTVTEDIQAMLADLPDPAVIEQALAELDLVREGTVEATADARAAGVLAAESADQAVSAATSADAARQAAEQTRIATEATRAATELARGSAVAAAVGAQAVIDAGAAVVAAAPAAQQAIAASRIAQAFALGAGTGQLVTDLVPGLAAPQRLWLDSRLRLSARSGQAAEAAAAAAAIPAPAITVSDLVTIDKPRFLRTDSRRKIVYQSQDPVPSTAVLAASVLPLLPQAVSDLVRGSGPAILHLDSGLRLRIRTDIARSAAGDAPVTPPALPVTVADVGSIRNAATRCAVQKRFFPSAARPVIAVSLQHGQSLDVALGDAQIYTTTPAFPGRVLMLNGAQGVRAMPGEAFTETGLTDARELVNGAYGESGHVAMVNRIASLIGSALGDVPLFGAISSGRTNTQLIDLGPGSASFESLLYALQRFRDFADARGYDVMVPWVRSQQGNADMNVTSRGMFAQQRVQYRKALDERVKALTGQREDVILYASVPDNGPTGFAVESGVFEGAWEACARDPLIRMLPTHGDIVKDPGGGSYAHPYSLGYLWIGERDGEAIFRDYYCGGAPAFRIVRAWRKPGNRLGVIVTVPVTPLVIDTANAFMPGTALPGLGWAFDDGSGAPPAITAVTLVNGARTEVPEAELELTLAAAPTGPAWRLFHAGQRFNDTWRHGMLTAMRDSAAAVSTFGADGQPAGPGNPGRPLPNIMPPQSVTL